ncbi:hypothetical protein ACTUTK_00520 [Pantoea ananatis]|uniref:hypothetical protein n=1 Tax=Pantoea ananas TaxID=553 RepID=UPI001059F1F5|nr:hypothetical protein [Pantoea ananatis]TDL50739.1 hypothetical protein E2R52_17380 [Pantoea ananatis]
MENYIYETANGEVGYFKIENDICIFHPFSDFTFMRRIGEWERRLRFDKINSEDPDNFTPSETLVLENMNYFLSQNRMGGPYEVTNKIKLNDAGCYFPRINRGEPLLSDHQISSPERADEIKAFNNILISLEDIFRTLEPEATNFIAYGNRIRELLIISCTEVEYLLKRAVIENGRQPKRKHFTTVDYVWCLSVQKLNEYEVNLPTYPALASFKPFQPWTKTNPTGSLFWYDAYNKVKHDRGSTKKDATLGALINAIAAIHILLEAQYGRDLFDFRMQHTFRTLFKSTRRPTWNINDLCMPFISQTGLEWKQTKNHP